MLILLSILIWLLSAYKWSDWKNWKNYYSTILFFIVGDLVYSFLTYNHPLWEFIAVPVFNLTFTVLIMVFIAWPSSILLYLSLYPKTNWFLKALHVSKFIAFFMINELIIFRFDQIQYSNGWNIWWSLGFDIFMFPLLKIHHEKPPLAWLIALILAQLPAKHGLNPCSASLLHFNSGTTTLQTRQKPFSLQYICVKGESIGGQFCYGTTMAF
ncbi:MAG: CBO0543 family protein [Desulfitobacteriaceae bacterium]